MSDLHASFFTSLISRHIERFGIPLQVAIDGECRRPPDSSRAIADCVVPTRAATSDWVSPVASRA